MNGLKGSCGRVAAALALACLSFPPARATEWNGDDLMPQYHRISFSSASVGLVSSDGRFFVFAKRSVEFRQVTEGEFDGLLPKREPARPYEELTADSKSRVLYASDGTKFLSRKAYCAEGQSFHHDLQEGGRLIRDAVDPCDEITSVEIVGDQLWLGTFLPDEGQNDPGEGVVVQSASDGTLLKKIPIPGMVRAVRRDPYSGNIWATTNLAFFEISPTYAILSKNYLREDFDPTTERPTIFLSSAPKSSNELAIEERLLGANDARAFFAASLRVSTSTLQDLSLYKINMGYFGSNLLFGREKAFVSPDGNALVPFVVASARSGNEFAMLMVCAFDDPRVASFLQSLDIEGIGPGFFRRTGEFLGKKGKDARVLVMHAADCTAKYSNLGLFAPQAVATRLDRMAKQEESALKSVTASSNPWKAADEVVQTARELEKARDVRGMALINDYFKYAAGEERDALLYDRVMQEFSNDAVGMTALVGLYKLQGGEVYRHGAQLKRR